MAMREIKKQNKEWIYKFELGFWKPLAFCSSVGRAAGKFNP